MQRLLEQCRNGQISQNVDPTASIEIYVGRTSR
jgi:hypothetical protein